MENYRVCIFVLYLWLQTQQIPVSSNDPIFSTEKGARPRAVTRGTMSRRIKRSLDCLQQRCSYQDFMEAGISESDMVKYLTWYKCNYVQHRPSCPDSYCVAHPSANIGDINTFRVHCSGPCTKLNLRAKDGIRHWRILRTFNTKSILGRYYATKDIVGDTYHYKHELGHLFIYSSADRFSWFIGERLHSTTNWLLSGTSALPIPNPKYVSKWAISNNRQEAELRLSCSDSSEDILYPFGPKLNDEELEMSFNQKCSSSKTLITGIKVFEETYGIGGKPLYVCKDGYISLGERHVIDSFSDRTIRTQGTVIAPYLTRQRVCQGPRLFFHAYEDDVTADNITRKVLARASADVIQSSRVSNFKASSVVVITWYEFYSGSCITETEKTNTFQLVLVTDDQRTYAFFNYRHDGMARTVTGKFPTHGYKIRNKDPHIEGLSGYNDTTTIDRIKGNRGVFGQSFITLYDESQLSTGSTQADLTCKRWFRNTLDVTDFLYSNEFGTCPCTRPINHPGFPYFTNYIPYMHRHVWDYWTDRYDLLQNKFRQYKGFPICSYDSTSAVISKPPHAGFFHLYNEGDMNAYRSCCFSSNLCHLFYRKRPATSCRMYTGSMRVGGWGEPHLKTVDGKDYTFNGLGEYWMVRTINSTFTLQCRTRQATDKDDKPTNATVFDTCAVKTEDTEAVQIEASANSGLQLVIGGKYRHDFLKTNVTKLQFNNMIIKRNGTKEITVIYRSGWAFTVKEANRILSVLTTFPRKAFNATRGLLGVYNGDQFDDFTLPNGTILPANSSDEDIFHKFGKLWQIQAGESIFYYQRGKSYLDYAKPDYIPSFHVTLDKEMELKAMSICGNDTQCIFDFAMTKDADIALNTKEIHHLVDESYKLQSNTAPNLTCPDKVFCTVGRPCSFPVVTNDADGDTVTISVDTNIASTYSLDEETGSFTWTPGLSPVYIKFVARDSLGSTSGQEEVTIIVCSNCSGHGDCDVYNAAVVPGYFNYQIAICICKSGYSGKDCENDTDGCFGNPCQNTGGTCRDLSPEDEQTTGNSFDCGICPTGFRKDRGSCVDINECEEGSSECQHICKNTDGSFDCSCFKNYRLEGDKKTCASEGTTTCTQTCDHICDSTKNRCTCYRGYVLGDDQKSCIDINECVYDEYNKCEQTSNCVNLLGTFRCSCDPGYTLNLDKRTCTECNETHWGTNCKNICNCGHNVKKCNKTNGCTICQEGWQGYNCEENINECSYINCGQHAECNDTMGSYVCVCRVGFTKNIDGKCMAPLTSTQRSTRFVSSASDANSTGKQYAHTTTSNVDHTSPLTSTQRPKRFVSSASQTGSSGQKRSHTTSINVDRTTPLTSTQRSTRFVSSASDANSTGKQHAHTTTSNVDHTTGVPDSVGSSLSTPRIDRETNTKQTIITPTNNNVVNTIQAASSPTPTNETEVKRSPITTVKLVTTLKHTEMKRKSITPAINWVTTTKQPFNTSIANKMTSTKQGTITARFSKMTKTKPTAATSTANRVTKIEKTTQTKQTRHATSSSTTSGGLSSVPLESVVSTLNSISTSQQSESNKISERQINVMFAVDVPFKAHFRNKSHPETRILLQNVEEKMTDIFNKLDSFSTVSVLELRHSSMEFDIMIEFDRPQSILDMTKVGMTLKQAVSNGTIFIGQRLYRLKGDLTIRITNKGVKRTVSITGVCFLYEAQQVCTNGGHCAGDARAQEMQLMPKCKCKFGFSGPECKDNFIFVITLVLGGTAVLLFFVTLAVIVGIVHKRRKAKQ